MTARQQVLVLAAAAAFLLNGCSTLDVASTEANFEPALAETYLWNLEPNRDPNLNPMSNSPVILGQIQNAIETELNAKGYRKTASPKADLQVGFLIVASDGTTPTIVDRYFGGGDTEEASLLEKANSYLSTKSYEAGTLVVDLRDGPSGKPVWRGAFGTEIDRARTPEERKRHIEEAVHQAMASLPARS